MALQLVLFSGSTPITTSQFGLGTGRMVINNAQCDGSEARLIDCRISGTACYYVRHAGVSCQVQKSTKYITILVPEIHISSSQLLDT